MSNKDNELYEQARRRVKEKIKDRCVMDKDVIIDQEKEIEIEIEIGKATLNTFCENPALPPRNRKDIFS